MKSIILLLFIAFLKCVTSTEPTISMSCQGEHQYVDDDGKCRTCEKCPPGTQIHGACGFGNRDSDYKCVECATGHFTATAGYNVCIVCTPCQTWNTVYDVECAPTQNSVCGSCIEGYYRRKLRGDTLPDEECSPCSESTKDEPECMESADFPWSALAIAGWSFASFAVLIIGIGCFCHRKSDRKRHERVLYGITPSSTPINASQSLEDSRSESSVVELDQLQPTFPMVTSHIDEPAPPAKIGATTPFLPSIPPRNTSYMPSQRYSNVPTAQFGGDSLSNCDRPTPSNLPTRLYDEEHPSQINNAMALSRHNNTVMIPPQNFRPPHRRHNEFVSHHENLSDRRDSKYGQRSPEPLFEPESFDTASETGDMTRSH